MRIFKIGILSLLVAYTFIANAHEGKTLKGFKTPESAVSDANGRVFVSEMLEFGKDGDGQISVIEPDGRVHVFAKGLNDPKGLVLVGNTLFVADKTEVMKISEDGVVQAFAPASAFPIPPIFLNDLEADKAGNIYVSDSGDLKGQGGGGAIYKITPQGQVSLVISGKQDARILAPNGLLMGKTDNCLYLVDFISGILYRYDFKPQKLLPVARGFGGGDGLVKRKKDLYVSDWKGGKVFLVHLKKGVVVEGELLRENFQAAADISLSKDERYLLIPDMKAGELIYMPLHD